MRKTLVLATLAFCLQGHAALEVDTKDNSALTKEAQTAVLQYVDENCEQGGIFFPTQIDERSSQAIEVDQLHKTVSAELNFYFVYSDDFEYVKTDIELTRASVDQPWTAKVVKFHGAYACRQLE